MAKRTRYLNTDLDIVCDEDLSALADFFRGERWSVLRADWHPGGGWLGVFEAPHRGERTPGPTIARMLKVLEALPDPLNTGWNRCSKRDFNVGYEAGTDRSQIEFSLSNALLAKIAAVGASVTVTIYPPHQE